MALFDVAAAQLWEPFGAGGGAELMRDAVRVVFQELIEAEAAEAIGAGGYERSQTRTNERNGHRARLLAAQARDVGLRVPKLRRGSFMPSVIEPRRCIDRALHAVAVEAYVAGVSTRSADDLVAALGAESGISKSEVSRICAGLDDTVEAFRGRRLDRIEFPYACLDATYLKARNSVGQPTSAATVAATGIAADAFPKAGPLTADAKHEVLAFAAFPQSAPAKDLDPPTPSNASTKRSNADPEPRASTPTKPQPSASSAPSPPTSTTNRRPPTGATSHKTP